jgi:hypothetical protein
MFSWEFWNRVSQYGGSRSEAKGHTGCSVTTRSVEGASGLVGCWFWTEAVAPSQAGADSCLEENQEEMLPNILSRSFEKMRRLEVGRVGDVDGKSKGGRRVSLILRGLSHYEPLSLGDTS